MPFDYVLWRLCERFHILQPDLEARLGEPAVQAWVRRSLLFMRLEGEAEVKR